jgi:N-acetylglutamate synthase-like GNAT family acetyltransferase
VKITRDIKQIGTHKIAKQIYFFIQNEKSLTNRKYSEIVNSLDNNYFHIALKGPEVIGFICKELLISNFHEIRSWYVKPDFRGNGIGDNVMKSALSDNKTKYLTVTFYPEMRKTLKRYGFKDISILELPFGVMLNYIFTRNYKSIFRHIFMEKSYLLAKI